MPFEWNEIQGNWLYGISVPFSREEITEAFNRVEKIFGSELFEKYQGIRGNYVVTLVVDLGKIIEEIEKGNCRLRLNGEIVQKIKRNDLYSVSTLVRLAAYYLRHSAIVEFEPTILVGKKLKRPDLRAKIDEKWVYIEETKLDMSLHLKNVTLILERISDVLGTIDSNINIEVSVLKDKLTPEEVNEVKDRIRCLSSKSIQPQQSLTENLARICTYRIGQERPRVQEKRPALGISSLSVGGGFERHLNVQIPFTDVRIEKILKKSKQLSPKESNMIVLDISIPGNLNGWSRSIREVLHPKKHRRIGAVLLVEKALHVKSLKIRSSLIVHPNPTKPLPRKFIQLVKSHYRKYPEYCYRPSK